MTVKRYDFGTEYKSNTGVPAIIGKVDGRYVKHDDYAACVLHNEVLTLRLQKLSVQATRAIPTKMTKVTLPEPVAYAIKAANTGKVVSVCLASDAGYQGVDQMAQEHVNPLISTDQLEAYTDVKVREALEEAAQVCWSLRCSDEFDPEIQDRLLKLAEDKIRAMNSMSAAT